MDFSFTYANLIDRPASSLYHLGNAAAFWLQEERGYDRAGLNSVAICSDSIDFNFTLRDTFQDGLSYDLKVAQDTNFYLYPNPEADLKSLLDAVPTRAERELKVLSRKLGNVVELKDMLISAAGRKFVEDVIEARNKYLALPGLTL